VYSQQACRDTKPGGLALVPEGHAAIQRDVNRLGLEKWADLMNLMNYNKKCKVLHL